MSTASGDDYIVVEPGALVVTDQAVVDAADRSPRFQWPFLLVAVVGLFSLVLVALGNLREGMAGIVLALVLATALRLVLPTRTAGWLCSRGRAVDTCCLAAAAIGLAGTLFLLS